MRQLLQPACCLSLLSTQSFYCLLAMISMLDASAATFSAWWGKPRKCDRCVMKSWRNWGSWMQTTGMYCPKFNPFGMDGINIDNRWLPSHVTFNWTCSRSQSARMGFGWPSNLEKLCHFRPCKPCGLNPGKDDEWKAAWDSARLKSLILSRCSKRICPRPQSKSAATLK